MRLHRFYVSQPLGEEVVIDDVSTIKQWMKVFRYKKGDFVVLFNGEGTDLTYELQSIAHSSSALRYIKQSPAIIPKRNVTLYLSLIKKDNFELVVQKAVEVGITTIVPVIATHSEKKNLNLDRLNVIIKEALEQCGRGDTASISEIIKLPEAIEYSKKHDIAYFFQMNSKLSLYSLRNLEEKSVGIFIGPEGGWSMEEEQTFISAKIEALNLGETTLRAETAAIAASAYICA